MLPKLMRHVSPLTLFLASWAMVISAYTFPWGGYPTLDIFTLFFVLWGIAAYCLGYLLGTVLWVTQYQGRLRKGNVKEGHHNKPLRRTVLLASVLGFIGATALAVEFLVIRKLDYNVGIGAVRLQLAEGRPGSGSVASVIGRVLSGWGPVAGMTVFLRHQEMPRSIRAVGLLSTVAVMATSLLEGGRNTIALIVAMLFGALVVRSVLRRRVAAGYWAGLALTVVTAAIVFAWMFLDRATAAGWPKTQLLSAIEQRYFVEFPAALHGVQSEPFRTLVAIFAFAYLYMTHSLSELDFLLSHGDPPLFLGRYNFHTIVLFMHHMGLGISPLELSGVLPRVGVYVSALGEMYLDYGILGALLAFLIIGACSGWVWRLMRAVPRVENELLAVYILTGAMVSPLYSILPVANGFYVLLAILVLKMVRLGKPRR